MHADSLDRWQHGHVFLWTGHQRSERKTWMVIGLTTAMMVGEIIGGSLFGSMALITDGLHMSTHAGALLIAALAHTFSRRHPRNSRFAFGTGKFGDLTAFTSAIVLAMIALLIGYEAVQRLFHPVAIAFSQAIPVAALGLVVNLASTWRLRDDHDHRGAYPERHHHHAGHAHHGYENHGTPREVHGVTGHEHHRDNNLQAAYIHVLADAATSVPAIVGLMAGLLYGWVFMDPILGIVGALAIANWSYGLVRDAGEVLLDVTPDQGLAENIRRTLESDDDKLSDLHLWRVGPGHFGAIISIVTHRPKPPSQDKARFPRARNC